MRLVHHAIGACAAILAVTAVPACTGEEEAVESHSEVSKANIGVAGVGIGDPAFSLCSEAEALSVLRALNMGEIAILQSVREQLQRPELKALADQLIEEHTQLHAATEAAARVANVPPIDSPVAQSLMQKAERAVQDIGGMADVDDIDRQFVADQILSHVAGLGLIDKLVLPSIRDPRLAIVAMRARMMMLRHVRHAFQMQAALEPPCHERLPMPSQEEAIGRPGIPTPGELPGQPPVGMPRGAIEREPVEIPGPMGGPSELMPGVGEDRRVPFEGARPIGEPDEELTGEEPQQDETDEETE